jgi:hypothetical protein
MQSTLPTSKKPSKGFLSNKRLKFPTAPNIFGAKGVATTKSGYKRLDNDERINRNLEAAAIAAEKDNPQLATCLRTMQPVLKLFIKCAAFPPSPMALAHARVVHTH